ncbi:flavin reductase family protein [Catenuloplanes atrovinosus]|uniref:Flavin reductase (DIM6/NTAB) family NADH-FMN oxidoreductase RutF n=1 Tax=Catenuloplanes atrovinosus TaxID=137266 RepID=A0AAE3YGG1_9ACTN|nr:flavin reductase family protein [Catenuloplanes atrovinosus]MDR7273533.1 flavin reductase (DIM6/NTAB) family NADH-FMN oxidoreductase RutF [Catenuloplanes atrovinosus]
MVELPRVPEDERALRAAYSRFPSGVVAVAALVDGRPAGMSASSFTSVSLDPPLVSVNAHVRSATWARLGDRPRLGLSVLSEDQAGICRRLATRGLADRFAGIPWRATDGGAVFVEGATAWLECEITQRVPAGDHEIVLLRLHAVATSPERRPLVFHASAYHRLA